MTTVTHTTCKPLNWLIDRAAEKVVLTDPGVTYYEWSGRVNYRMASEVREWLKANNARYSDGRSTTSFSITLSETVDFTNRTYKAEFLTIAFGNHQSSANTVRSDLMVYDTTLTDEDVAEMQARAA